MESYQFPLHQASVHIALFHNVANAAQLRSRLVSASTMEGPEGDKERDLLDYAFIEANMIVNRDQLLTAVYSALQADAAGSLKTKTLHSEILLSLHPASTPQINDALRKFGISPSTRNLILVRVNKPMSTERAQEDVEQACVDEMSDLVQGDISSLDSLGGMADSQVDWKGLKKLYKLNEMNLASGAPSTEQELQLLESVIVSTIATKPVAN